MKGMDASPASLLLCEVYASGYSGAPAGTYVRVWNPGPSPVDLTGWRLVWNDKPVLFPAGAVIASGECTCVAWDARGFYREVTSLPEFAVYRPTRGVALMNAPEGNPEPLVAGGGLIRLADPDGRTADLVVWGRVEAPQEWPGIALPELEAGMVYQRAVDEATLTGDSPGRFEADSSLAAAWRQGSDWIPRRQKRSGQAEFPYPTVAAAGGTAFVAPDSSFAAVTRFIDQAQEHLDINLYLFTNDEVAERVEAALQRKVHVRLLVEGEPFEGMGGSALAVIRRLEEAGASLRLLKAAEDGFKRFHFNHAKYAVADGRYCLVMSDNWTHDSVPKVPTTGKRGWGIALDSPALAAHLRKIFEADWNPNSPDSALLFPIRPLGEEEPELAGEMNGEAVSERREEIPDLEIVDPIQPQDLSGPALVTPVLAPNHALLENLAISGLIRGAGERLDILQQSLQLFWGMGPEGSPETMPNLLLAEVVAAARRGVKVRVLTTGAYQDDEDPRENNKTVAWLNQLARGEQLSLEARLLDPASTGMGIHDKGVIADGQQVLISSINWSQNSPLNNRELGLIVRSSEVAGYFTRVFERDWNSAAE